MKILNKSLTLGAAIAASMALTALAPEAALAHGKKSAARPRAASSAPSISSSTERRLQAMEDEIASLRAELSRAKSAAPAKVEEIETKQQQLEQQVAEVKAHEETHHDLLFFRGGYAAMSHARSNELLINNTALNGFGATTTTGKADGNGWYVGAGFDHRLTDDLWGLTDIAAVDGEVMFEYKNFGSQYNALVQSATGTILTGNALTPGVTIKNQVTQFTLSASPKIKFNLLDGALRPWIIPFGLSINVISPPSSGVTVLNPGLMLGTGVEYRIWKELWAGIDFRYNFTGGDLNYKTTVPGVGTVLNETNTDGFTTGGYIGFGF